MYRLFLLALLGLLLTACAERSAEPTAAETAATTSAAPEPEIFGADFAVDDAIPAGALLTTYLPAQLSDTVRTTLRGEVREVCQAKGCWMTIGAGESMEMTVKFRDYGFFVPKDIGGREVVMHGQAFYQETPVEELRHFAEDAGKSPAEIAAITEPRRELHFVADGVRLLN